MRSKYENNDQNLPTHFLFHSQTLQCKPFPHKNAKFLKVNYKPKKNVPSTGLIIYSALLSSPFDPRNPWRGVPCSSKSIASDSLSQIKCNSSFKYSFGISNQTLNQ